MHVVIRPFALPVQTGDPAPPRCRERAISRAAQRTASSLRRQRRLARAPSPPSLDPPDWRPSVLQPHKHLFANARVQEPTCRSAFFGWAPRTGWLAARGSRGRVTAAGRSCALQWQSQKSLAHLLGRLPCVDSKSQLRCGESQSKDRRLVDRTQAARLRSGSITRAFVRRSLCDNNMQSPAPLSLLVPPDTDPRDASAQRVRRDRACRPRTRQLLLRSPGVPIRRKRSHVPLHRSECTNEPRTWDVLHLGLYQRQHRVASVWRLVRGRVRSPKRSSHQGALPAQSALALGLRAPLLP